MCLVFSDASDLGEDMSDPWKDLANEIFNLLSEEIKDFSSDLKDSSVKFLEEQSLRIAKEKWRHLHAETEEERRIAVSNLRHLKGQIRSEIVRLELASTQRALDLLEKVILTAIEFSVRIVPALL